MILSRFNRQFDNLDGRCELWRMAVRLDDAAAAHWHAGDRHSHAKPRSGEH